MMRIAFESYDYIFPELLPKEGDKAPLLARLYDSIPMNSVFPIKHLRGVGGLYQGPGDELSDLTKGLSIFNVEFTEAPSTPHQKFLVTLTLGDGKKFEKEIEFDVVEYKPSK